MGHKILLFLALITTVVITTTLATLIIANGVLKTFQSMAAKGLTIFTVNKVLPKKLFGKISIAYAGSGACDVSKSSTCFVFKSGV